MRRGPALALLLVIASVLLSPLQRELYVGDETKYSQVVREMRGGSLLLPTLNGSPFTHKPPLHFWLMDALTHVFGVYSIWSFVIPSLLAFVLLLVLMHRMGGPMAAFVCGTSLLMWGSAQTARMDVAFAGLLALAAYFIHRADGRLTVPAGVATGIAFLVKGPMAPVITLSLALFELVRRKLEKRRDAEPRNTTRSTALAILTMLTIPLLWLVPALLVGGEPFWREIFYKQTVGRAVGAWVHKSPPWFYVVRAPLTLMPWFFLAVAALVRVWREPRSEANDLSRFSVSWILAVLVPYTLLSSKLDVYMIAMIPAIALLVGQYVVREDVWGRRANLVMLALLAIVAVAGLVAQPSWIKGEDAALVARTDVRALFALLLVASIVAIVTTLRARTLVTSTIATGLVLVATLSYAAIALVPVANELASTRPLVRALEKQQVAASEVALFMCPHLWTRGMSPELARAHQVDAYELRTMAPPRVVVTRRRNAGDIEDVLRGYRRVDELRMIGKWFDVYRR